MLANINARRTTDGGVYVSYDEDGKAKSGVHLNWARFVAWLALKLPDFEPQSERGAEGNDRG